MFRVGSARRSPGRWLRLIQHSNAVCMPHRFQSQNTSSTTPELPQSSLNSRAEIEEYLSKPTWNVAELLSSGRHGNAEAKQHVTRKELHHLLRLSALPVPKMQEEEDEMLKTLEAQLGFVKAVQDVDTADVEPLVAIRDETRQAEKEAEITPESLRHVLDREEQVGRYKRIVVKNNSEGKDDAEEKQEALQWDPIERAPSKIGRFIKVNTKES